MFIHDVHMQKIKANLRNSNIVDPEEMERNKTNYFSFKSNDYKKFRVMHK